MTHWALLLFLFFDVGTSLSSDDELVIKNASEKAYFAPTISSTRD